MTHCALWRTAAGLCGLGIGNETKGSKELLFGFCQDIQFIFRCGMNFSLKRELGQAGFPTIRRAEFNYNEESLFTSDFADNL